MKVFYLGVIQPAVFVRLVAEYTEQLGAPPAPALM